MHYLIVGGFILLDLITGIIKAFKNKDYSSSVMREGLYHKIGSVIAVAFGTLVDYAQSYLDLGVAVPMTLSICTYICLMEIGSTIENVSEINPQLLPDKLKAYFKKLSDK